MIDMITGKVHIPAGIFFIMVMIICIIQNNCAIVNKKASEYAFGEECVHCHGEKLEGNKNILLQCGDCHELKPLPVENLTSEAMKKIVLSEPHIHKTRNMFSNTPSCFLCHRQNDF